MSVVDASDPFGLRAQLADAQRRIDALQQGGGGGTSGSVTEDWKVSVDRRLRDLHDDFRRLLQWGAGAVVVVVAMIGGLYLRTDAKFEAINARMAAIERRADRIELKLDQLLERMQPTSDRPTPNR